MKIPTTKSTEKMNDSNVITSEDGRIASALHALKKCAKEVDKLMDDFHPPLGGERYMTDKEVIARLKVSDVPCRSIVPCARYPISCSAAKSSIGNPTSKRCSRKTTARQFSENGNGQVLKPARFLACPVQFRSPSLYRMTIGGVVRRGAVAFFTSHFLKTDEGRCSAGTRGL